MPSNFLYNLEYIFYFGTRKISSFMTYQQMRGGEPTSFSAKQNKTKNLYCLIYFYTPILKINKGFPCKGSYCPVLSQPALRGFLSPKHAELPTMSCLHKDCALAKIEEDEKRQNTAIMGKNYAIQNKLQVSKLNGQNLSHS